MTKTFEYRALGAYKEELFKLICNSGQLSTLLINLIMPTLDDDRFDTMDNFLGGEYTYYNTDGTAERVHLQGHLFDVPFVYSTITTSCSCICMDTNISKANQSIKEMAITLYVMCHKDFLEIDSVTKRTYKQAGYIGRNRIDLIVAILGDILNNSDIKALGKLLPTPINPVTPYFPNADFYGKILLYTTSDFMIDYATLSREDTP